ncbi:uncharacterized [Tachysurus ichikawai]
MSLFMCGGEMRHDPSDIYINVTHELYLLWDMPTSPPRFITLTLCSSHPHNSFNISTFYKRQHNPEHLVL